MTLYRYRPKGNRTPCAHPAIGHLQWDGLYGHPDCAGNPDFEPVGDAQPFESVTDAALQPVPESDAEPEPEPDPEPEPAESEPESASTHAFPYAPTDKPPADSDADAAQSGWSQ